MHTDEPAPRYSLVAGTSIACRLVGVDPMDMLAAAGLSPDIERHETVGVTGAEFYRAWDALVALAPASDAPITLGKALARGHFIPPMFALTCAPNLEEGLSRLAPYKALIGPTAWRVEVDAPNDVTTIAFDPLEAALPLPVTMAAMQAVLVLEAVRACTGVAIVPRDVRLADADHLAGYFQRPPRPGVRASLSLRRADALRPFVSESPQLWKLFQADLDARVIARKRSAPIAERVRATVRSLLAQGRVSLVELCDELGMGSPRTLQHALKEDGQSYSELLAESRRDLALRYLRTSNLRNEEIAHLLGYRDPNSFYRAFVRWTGTTPSEVRRLRAP